jgi:hypothetical protein
VWCESAGPTFMRPPLYLGTSWGFGFLSGQWDDLRTTSCSCFCPLRPGCQVEDSLSRSDPSQRSRVAMVAAS